MKTKTCLMMAAVILFAQVGQLWASTVFTVSASVPAATSVGISAASVTGTTFTSVTGTALTFGAMTFDNVIPAGSTTAPNVWRAPNYFAIDIANNGAGSPNVTIVYADTAKPAGQNHGLGYKGTLDLKKVTGSGSGTVDSAIAGHAKKALKDVVNEVVLPAETTGGWLRAYVGIADGSVGSIGEAFSATDLPGTYAGTLTITATPN